MSECVSMCARVRASACLCSCTCHIIRTRNPHSSRKMKAFLGSEAIFGLTSKDVGLRLSLGSDLGDDRGYGQGVSYDG